MTSFELVYDAFFSLITDDMYMELSEEETKKDCRSLLMASIPLFEFPRSVLNITTTTNIDGSVNYFFEPDLSLEEINILATGMVQIWLQRQVNSVEVIRQKFSGPDFKVTSQAAHLTSLNALLNNIKREHRRLQMLYSRREIYNGKYKSTFDKIAKPRASRKKGGGE